MIKSSKQHLIEHGISPTIQRLAIMDYLMNFRTHPTVSDIYMSLLPQIPTLSKTTVNNTLKLFVDQKLVKHIDIDERNARFDGVLETHAHFRCKKCGLILDIPLLEIQDFFSKGPDFTIDEAYVNVKGLCNKCLNSTN
ncbi:MAG: transcriptional repressor [Tannerella sp.]|jgi:Fe2+ or Zn2+ uptake regulation protein|nr:transcriptional repressor [Tannerella sp.]